MTEPKQTDRKPTFVAGSLVVPQLPDERLATLTQMEFYVLRDGNVSDAKSARDLCIGIFVSAVTALIGLYMTVDWETAFHQGRKGQIILVMLLVSLGLFSGCSSVVFHLVYRHGRYGSAYSTLMKKLESRLLNSESLGRGNDPPGV